MAIQIRRGTNANWESNYSNIVSGEPAITTDSERFLVGTSSGTFAEFSNINELAEPYDVASSYIVGQTCNYKGQIYVCLSPTSGTWDSTKWNAVTLSESVLSTDDYLELANLMATAYDSSATYFEGQFVTYSGNVYEANVDIATAESWNSSHWNLIGSAC